MPLSLSPRPTSLSRTSSASSSTPTPSTRSSPAPSHPDTSLALIPGRSLGPFQLSTSLYPILSHLRTHPLLHSSSLTLHHPTKRTTAPLVLRLPPSLHLVFDGPSQRLCLIHLELPAPGLEITYRGRVIVGKGERVTRAMVGGVFGPTRRGERGRWPGMEWAFEGGEDNRSANATLLIVHPPTPDPEAPLTIPSASPPTPQGEIDHVDIIPGRTATFHLPGLPPIPRHLHSTTPSDFTSLFGPPTSRFYKQDDRLDIHVRSSSSSPSSSSDSYFLNYPTHGFDALFSRAHRLLKLVLHTNLPGTPLFHAYKRCPWRIIVSPLPSPSTSLIQPSGTHATASEDGAGMAELDAVSFTDKISTILELLSPDAPPDRMDLDRAREAGLDWKPPLGITELVGLPGLVLEVTQEGDVASVCVC